MSDVIFNSLLIGSFLIFFAVGIFFQNRKNVSEISIKEKISTLNSHFQEYRFWYFGIACMALVPVLYYLWDEFFNPYKINYFPGPNVPSPQSADNNNITLFFDLPLMVFQSFKLQILGLTTIFMSVLLLLGPRIFKFNKNGFLFQTSLGIIVSVLLFFGIVVIVIIIFTLIGFFFFAFL